MTSCGVMASYNLVFVVNVESRCSSGDFSDTDNVSRHALKQWVLKILLSFGNRYGMENVRWGHRVVNMRSVKNSSLITRGADFKELTDKAFEDFEEELTGKFDARDKSYSQPSRHCDPAAILHNTLKEVLLDFQWDRPDITSPTKLTLRPRRSSRSGKNVSVSEDDHSSLGKNLLFLVSECPHSMAELRDFLSLPTGKGEDPKEVSELVLPRSLTDMLVLWKVALHWVDASPYAVGAADEDYRGVEVLSEVLKQMGGRVIPMHPLCVPKQRLPSENSIPGSVISEANGGFPADSSICYILSSERTYRRAFPSLTGHLCLGTGEDAHTCPISLEAVSCGQGLPVGPLVVTLRGVVRGGDALALAQTTTESWVLQLQRPNDSDQFHAILHHLLSTRDLYMLADVSGVGGVACSAVMSALSSCGALLSVLQPLVAQGNGVGAVTDDVISTESQDDSADLPDVVNSVLGVMFNMMDSEEEGVSDLIDSQVPDWAKQELQQQVRPLTAGLAEGWFPFSDSAGISGHLMESMRLLHAVPEEPGGGDELSDSQLELFCPLSELYQSNASGCNSDPKAKKRGAQRTPVRQKMKTMSRSLQMLNVARLNAMVQKTQTDPAAATAPAARGTEGTGKRRAGERAGASTSVRRFQCEEDLVSHLKQGYQTAVAAGDPAFRTQVQGLFSAVRSYMKSCAQTEGQFLSLIQTNLLKTSKSVRQLYGNASDVESKIRESQFQVVLRLELCKIVPSDELNPDQVELLMEEVADMLRIISLTKDPVYLTKFMRDEILAEYLTAIPRVLADVYHSLGTQLPEELIAVLPPDVFSDDSMARESVSPSLSLQSARHSQASDAGDRLEELHSRSARRKRGGVLTRHKSMTEASQAHRQIEMPRKSTRVAKVVPVEKPTLEQVLPQKTTVQEVTKVRRNLFNQNILSPSKRTKFPRSQSVSAVEGMRKRKRSEMTEDADRRTLLTKKVTETPLHKQVSNRLLHKQMKGRRSDTTDVCIVEESPVKPAADLRRSPRIKNFSRRHSSVFYSSSQPRSRNLDRALSSTQLPRSDSKKDFDVSGVRSPMRLLFGATKSPGRPSTSSCGARSTRRSPQGSTNPDVFESPRQTPRKSPTNQTGCLAGSRTPRTPLSSKSPGMAVVEGGVVLRGSPFRSPARRSLVLGTPQKASPLKGILRTPVKSLLEGLGPAGSCSLQSPQSRTPRKSVTWSPSPRKLRPERPGVTLKVTESPRVPTRCSPRLLTPSKLCSPNEGKNTIFKTPDKLPPRKRSISPEDTLSSVPESLEKKHQNDNLCLQSEKIKRTLTFPCKAHSRFQRFSSITNDQDAEMLTFPDHPSPPTPELLTPVKSPRPTHGMTTRSGRTPLKDGSTPPNKTRAAPQKSPLVSKRLANSPQPLFERQGQKSLDDLSSPSKALSEASQRRLTRCPSSLTLQRSSSGVEGSCSPAMKRNLNPQSETLHRKDEGPQEEGDSSSDSQQLDSTQFSAVSTEDESMDISEATVVETRLSGGIKMNISFTRRPSKSNVCEDVASSTPGRCYGFRKTPDRQQREAAARLGYPTGPPKLSTPRTSGTPGRRKGSAPPTPLTYQVELEMQASGVPKLKFKRTDSSLAFEASDANGGKAARVDSPLTVCAKHRDPGCISPSLCPRGTPAKGTPGKGGVQTYICQSCTPTRLTSSCTSPVGPGEPAPWTPSPQSRGRSTPDGLRNWPRRKRAGTGVLPGLKGESLPEEMEVLEDPELDGVFRLRDVEECQTGSLCKDFLGVRSMRSNLRGEQQIRRDPLILDQDTKHRDLLERMDWMESLGQQCDGGDPLKDEALPWMAGMDTISSVVTPPSSKVKKPVSATGILTLTQSPMLYKGRATSAAKDATQFEEPEALKRSSPFRQPRQRSTSGRTYSRKRLLD